MTAIELNIEPAESTDARSCLAQYFAELGAIFDTGYDPARAVPISEAEMNPPLGWFVIARIDGEAVGCGVLKRVGTSTGEIKRVWTSPNARGKGVARAVMLELERIARAAGFLRVRLDTNTKLEAAQAMYRRLGYQEVPRFNDDPYPTHFFARDL